MKTRSKIAGVILSLATIVGVVAVASNQNAGAVATTAPPLEYALGTVVVTNYVKAAGYDLAEVSAFVPMAMVLPRHGCSAIQCPPHAHYACTNTGGNVCHRWQLANFQWVQGPLTLLSQQWGYVAILCTYSSTTTNPGTSTKWWPNTVAPPAGGGTWTHLACQYPRTGIVPWSASGLPFWPA
jgi:hypothetical protein